MQKEGNILKAIEDSIILPNVNARVQALAKERDAIQEKLKALEAKKIDADSVQRISSEVARFILNFEEEFDRVSMEERKMLLRKCISEVVVDREKKMVRFYVNRVPGVNIGLSEEPQGVQGVTLRSARSRVHT